MKRLTITLTILAISITFAQGSYAAMNDKSDRFSLSQSSVFSPGYINASKQKTDEIVNQRNKPKTMMENITEYMKNKLSKQVAEDAEDSPKIQLKHKTGGAGGSPVASETTKLVDSTNDNLDISIGNGTDKVIENGRLISEVINGNVCVYVGFSNAGVSTIQQAIDRANAGDFIIVAGGDYATFDITKAVKLYGGYSDSGVRDLTTTPTRVNGTITANWLSELTEINGFYIDAPVAGIDIYLPAGIVVYNSQAVAIKNCEIRGLEWMPPYFHIEQRGLLYSGVGISIDHSNVELSNNKIEAFNAGIYATHSDISLGENEISAPDEIYTPDSAVSYGITDSTAPNFKIDISRGDMNNAKSLFSRSGSGHYDYNMALDDMRSRFFGNNEADNLKGSDNGTDAIPSIFRGLLANKDMLQSGAAGEIDQKLLARIAEDALGQSALSLPIGSISPEDMRITSVLTSIIKDPTQDQKLILDAMTALLSDVNKQGDNAESSELKKATDDILQVVVAVLIAQAIPDLFKEGDLSDIKNIFTELNVEKSKMILQYQDSTKPYYSEMIKELSKNMNILQLKDIISGKMTRDELERILPNELDKIVQKLRQAKDRSFEAEYILQQEAKYRKQYLDPNKKILENKMKDMMNDFTKRLSKILEDKEVAKK